MKATVAAGAGSASEAALWGAIFDGGRSHARNSEEPAIGAQPTPNLQLSPIASNGPPRRLSMSPVPVRHPGEAESGSTLLNCHDTLTPREANCAPPLPPITTPPRTPTERGTTPPRTPTERGTTPPRTPTERGSSRTPPARTPPAGSTTTRSRASLLTCTSPFLSRAGSRNITCSLELSDDGWDDYPDVTPPSANRWIPPERLPAFGDSGEQPPPGVSGASGEQPPPGVSGASGEQPPPGVSGARGEQPPPGTVRLAPGDLLPARTAEQGYHSRPLPPSSSSHPMPAGDPGQSPVTSPGGGVARNGRNHRACPPPSDELLQHLPETQDLEETADFGAKQERTTPSAESTPVADGSRFVSDGGSTGSRSLTFGSSPRGVPRSLADLNIDPALLNMKLDMTGVPGCCGRHTWPGAREPAPKRMLTWAAPGTLGSLWL
eukprot:gnl/TRDRNA2_/TRDRNA2_165721_c0_seq1.p1 gnl/TRDRNA2_/TRDRNA2_165721_c0~~gnl/TRDRNA2_/TRDRNA2_165721_c0_seq1.p1  ORF type:complete len:465 (-),score=54.91 gnl/TRDRNA2_/TRDRNA2_165721_c0_seq1:87-1391(-)